MTHFPLSSSRSNCLFCTLQIPNSLTQRVLRSSKTNQVNSVRDENKVANQQPTGKPGATVLGKGAASRVLTRRNALEDVSNIQNGNASNCDLYNCPNFYLFFWVQKDKVAKQQKTQAAAAAAQPSQTRVRVFNAAAKQASAKNNSENIENQPKKKTVSKVHNDLESKDVEEADSFEKKVQQQRQLSRKLHKNVIWDDLDAGDAEDPLMVPTYVVEIMEYMRELEVGGLAIDIKYLY